MSSIRKATLDDVPTIARHRCEMFSDMGVLCQANYQELFTLALGYYHQAIPSGEYHGWLVEEEGEVIAGGGVRLRSIIPRPARGKDQIQTGDQALIVDVYTHPSHRKRGLAEEVTRTIVAWCEERGVCSIVLHASPMGRPIYERIGFRDTNEMEYGR